jgi:ELWxxDGT repeat protein
VWLSDGTAAGTALVKDISGAVRSDLTASDGKLFFVANDNVHGYELWVSDGTEAGTRLVQDIYPGNNNFGTVGWLTDLDGILYFRAQGAGFRGAFWRTDGTPDGTYQVVDVSPSMTCDCVDELIRAGSRIYFTAITEALGLSSG